MTNTNGDNSIEYDILPATCRWWQCHKWGKWEFIQESWVRTVPVRYHPYCKNVQMKKEFKVRYCTRCGARKKVFVDSWEDIVK